MTANKLPSKTKDKLCISCSHQLLPVRSTSAEASAVFCSSSSSLCYCCAELWTVLPAPLLNIFPYKNYDCPSINAHVCRRRLFPDLPPFRRRVGWSRAHFHRGENGRQMSFPQNSWALGPYSRLKEYVKMAAQSS